MSDEQELRPFTGERVQYDHADGFGGEAIVTDHVRVEEDGPVVKATDTSKLQQLTLMPFEYTVPDYSDAVARHIRDTRKHIRAVRKRLNVIAAALHGRSQTHDDSKLEEPERSDFARVSDQLSSTTYGSDEYEALLDELQETALSHHYAENRHHPEHFDDGMAGMHLIDLVEMFADWAAAVERHDDGDLHESIEKNQDRFGYSDQLKRIFHHTAQWLEIDLEH